MTIHLILLTEAFEYIADAGYIAHIEKIAQINTVGTKVGKAKPSLYRKFTGNLSYRKKSIAIMASL